MNDIPANAICDRCRVEEATRIMGLNRFCGRCAGSFAANLNFISPPDPEVYEKPGLDGNAHVNRGAEGLY